MKKIDELKISNEVKSVLKEFLSESFRIKEKEKNNKEIDNLINLQIQLQNANQKTGADVLRALTVLQAQSKTLNGDAKNLAQSLLAYCEILGLGTGVPFNEKNHPKNPMSPFNLCKDASVQKYPLAQFVTARCLAFDKFGTQRDINQCVLHYEFASSKGISCASRELGLLYTHSPISEFKNPKKGEHFSALALKQQAERDKHIASKLQAWEKHQADAQQHRLQQKEQLAKRENDPRITVSMRCALHDFYVISADLNDLGIDELLTTIKNGTLRNDEDVKKAVEKLQELANGNPYGNKDALDFVQSLLAYCVQAGIGFPQKDNIKSMKLCQKSHDEKYRLAQFVMANAMAEEGQKQALLESAANSSLEFYKNAFVHFTFAADNGISSAQVALGDMYRKGIPKVVAKDPNKAFALYKQAKTNGNVLANYYLGQMYGLGEGTKVDENAAFDCYKAASFGHFALAKLALGTYYELGKGTHVDLKKAKDCYRAAKLLGYNAKADLERIKLKIEKAKVLKLKEEQQRIEDQKKEQELRVKEEELRKKMAFEALKAAEAWQSAEKRKPSGSATGSTPVKQSAKTIKHSKNAKTESDNKAHSEAEIKYKKAQDRATLLRNRAKELKQIADKASRDIKMAHDHAEKMKVMVKPRFIQEIEKDIRIRYTKIYKDMYQQSVEAVRATLKKQNDEKPFFEKLSYLQFEEEMEAQKNMIKGDHEIQIDQRSTADDKKISIARMIYMYANTFSVTDRKRLEEFVLDQWGQKKTDKKLMLLFHIDKIKFDPTVGKFASNLTLAFNGMVQGEAYYFSVWTIVSHALSNEAYGKALKSYDPEGAQNGVTDAEHHVKETHEESLAADKLALEAEEEAEKARKEYEASVKSNTKTKAMHNY